MRCAHDSGDRALGAWLRSSWSSVKVLILNWILLEERRQDLEQETELADQAAEVVAGRGEDGVGSFAMTESEIVAAHASS